MLLNSPCSCSWFTCGCVNTKNLTLVMLRTCKSITKHSCCSHHSPPNSLCFLKSKEPSREGSCCTQSGAQPALGGRCVRREQGGVRNGDTWSPGMLGQALQSPDTTYQDQTGFHPWGTKQVPKQKPQHHVSAQTQSKKQNRYGLKADFTLLPWNTLSPHHWQAGWL